MLRSKGTQHIRQRGYRAKKRLIRHVAPKLYGLPEIDLDQMLTRPIEIETPILEAISLPPHHDTYKHDDYSPLMKIARHINPDVVLELGTAHGNTTANLCRQFPNARIYTVNAPVEIQTGVITTYGLSREEIGFVYRKYGFEGRVTQIYANTMNLDLSVYFDNPQIRLCIIDACHDYEYVLNDFGKIEPFMAVDGVVMLHDVHPSMLGHLYGSYLACITLRRQGFNIRHVHGTWWGIWQNSDSW